jgi:hypothetical protein
MPPSLIGDPEIIVGAKRTIAPNKTEKDNTSPAQRGDELFGTNDTSPSGYLIIRREKLDKDQSLYLI